MFSFHYYPADCSSFFHFHSTLETFHTCAAQIFLTLSQPFHIKLKPSTATITTRSQTPLKIEGGNILRAHSAMYAEAVKLLDNDDPEIGKKGLDMLLTMRLIPDLSLYRRALVNFLMSQCGRFIIPTSHEDTDLHLVSIELYNCKKFADEALRLCQEMKRRYLPAGENHAYLIEIEETARGTLEEIAEVEAVMIKEGKKVFPPFVPDMTVEGSSEAGLVEYNPKQIEGSFSNYGPSYEERRNQEEEEKVIWEEWERERRLGPEVGTVQRKAADSSET